ncbi:hypothetical protein [Pseudomonas aeruginosa]|nr:hypothetical protein [Pseudomonas aeruginosa]MCG0483789.1 hypothetical protein [Pseudomonas aeruginosa]
MSSQHIVIVGGSSGIGLAPLGFFSAKVTGLRSLAGKPSGWTPPVIS